MTEGGAVAVSIMKEVIDSYVLITRIKPAEDLKHGKAYGIKVFKGIAEP
jgi:hypothetical protein